MSYNLLFLLALVIGAGVIAYIGDLIGRRMGKARLTLFGLRPRYTAIFMTVTTGILISSLTLFLMLTMAHNLREILLKGDQILRQNSELMDANRQLIRQQRQLKEQSENLQKKADEASAQNRKAQADIEKARQDQKKLSAQITEQQGKLKDYQVKLAEESRRLAQAQAQRAKVEAQAKIAARMFVTEQEKTYRLSKEVVAGEADYTSLRQKQIIYQVGDEVFRGRLERSGSASSIKQDILRLIGQAGAQALQKGAARSPGGKVVVVSLPVFKVEGAKNPIRVKEDEYLQALADKVRDFQGPAVLQVLARGNSIQGEPVSVDLKVFPLKKAFVSGERVACADFKPGDSITEITRQLREFFSGPVRAAAIEAGMIPRMKGGQAIFFEMDVDQLAALASRVKAAGGDKARLCALASGDVNTMGPLRLNFSVNGN